MPNPSRHSDVTNPHEPQPGSSQQLSIGQCVQLACMLDVTAPKPGNVHRGADFPDLCFADFVASSVIIGPILGRASERPVGESIRNAIRQTRESVGTNTNLGIVLLLAPLCCVPREVGLETGVQKILDGLTPSDARDVYDAIKTANPGGMGEVEEHDVASSPPERLLDAMELAAERDFIARQYSNGFEDLFRLHREFFSLAISAGVGLIDAVVWSTLR